MQLKRAGRLFHYCATPLILSASWRQSVLQKTMGRSLGADHTLPGEVTSSNLSLYPGQHGQVTSVSTVTTPATPDKAHKMRSRHSSGASMVSAKARLEDTNTSSTGRKGSGQADAAVAPLTHGHHSEPGDSEEAWHLELRQRFIHEYTRYLVSELGFIKLNVQPSAPKRGQPARTAAASADSSTVKRIGTVNLQKTLTGGIIVMELSFRQEFFCVRMFAVDCMQLGVMVNRQMHLIFVDECDKYKDLIHVHSFAHDFHLRCVQQHLTQRDSDSPSALFPDGFDLDSFLTDFRQIFSYPPSFSRNCLYQDRVSLPELPFPGHMLYNYMLKQMGCQEMNVLRMGDKFALVKLTSLDLPGLAHDQEAAEEGSSGEVGQWEGYDAGLVIINTATGRSPTDDPMKLELKFFTVLTRQRDCYPLRTLEKALGEFGGRRTTASSGESEPLKPVAVKQHIGLRKEHINYRGYSNVHQRSLYKALLSQSEKGKDNILEMVGISETKCRRDYLWQRLIVSRAEADEGSKRRSDTSDSSESVLSPLTSREFCELLDMVTLTPLSEFDPQLRPLFNMPLPWHQGLFTALANKYPDAYRTFHSPCRNIRYILVLNANNLDMFAMLSINKQEPRTDLCAVLKEPVAADSVHSPDHPNLPLYSLQTHVEDFVNVCCYHMWASML